MDGCTRRQVTGKVNATKRFPCEHCTAEKKWMKSNLFHVCSDRCVHDSLQYRDACGRVRDMGGDGYIAELIFGIKAQGVFLKFFKLLQDAPANINKEVALAYVVSVFNVHTVLEGDVHVYEKKQWRHNPHDRRWPPQQTGTSCKLRHSDRCPELCALAPSAR